MGAMSAPVAPAAGCATNAPPTSDAQLASSWPDTLEYARPRRFRPCFPATLTKRIVTAPQFGVTAAMLGPNLVSHPGDARAASLRFRHPVRSLNTTRAPARS